MGCVLHSAVQYWPAYSRDDGGLPARGVCDELPSSPECRAVARSLPDSAQTGYHHGVYCWGLTTPGQTLSLSPSHSLYLSLSLSLSHHPSLPPPPLQLIHVDKARPSVTEIAQLATDICRGLQYLHSINVLHRYIHVWTHTTRTPQNLCTMYYIQCKYYHT